MNWYPEHVLYQGKYHIIFDTLSFGFANVFSELQVTTRRVVRKEGILTRDIDEWVLNRIAAVEVDQSIWGKLFGFGTVKIYRSGQSMPDLIEKIAGPQEFRDAINLAKSYMEIPTAT